MKKSRYNTARKWLIFWTLFIGIGAVVGGVSMLIEPSGKILHMENMLTFFQKLPFADVLFRDYTFSGIALLIVALFVAWGGYSAYVAHMEKRPHKEAEVNYSSVTDYLQGLTATEEESAE